MCFRTVIFEQDDFVRSIVLRSLTQENYDVIEYNESLKEGLDLDFSNVRLVLISTKSEADLVQPLIEKIKDDNAAAGVVVMMNQFSKEHLVNYYTAGMDSFIEKPFDIDLFELRVNALRTRIESAHCQRAIGDVVVNIGEQMLMKDGNTVTLNPSEVKLMFRLLDNLDGDVLSKDDINQILYQSHQDIGQNSAKVYIYRLRDKLKKVGSDVVKIGNNYGNGYYLYIDEDTKN